MRNKLSGCVLNCGSLDETLESVAALMRRSAADLRNVLIGVQLRDDACIAPEDQLLSALGYESLEQLPSPDRIRWFHFSRVPLEITFNDGLLPTGQVLESIWIALGVVASELVGPDVWNAFRHDFPQSQSNSARQLAVKSRRELQGPFGFLVREAGEGVIGDHKDFTAFSEVTEDICSGFRECAGVDLGSAWQRRTSPCIVIFEVPAGDIGQHAVQAALMYAHHRLHSREQSFACNTCFDGGGCAVSPRDIVKVIRLRKTPEESGTDFGRS